MAGLGSVNESLRYNFNGSPEDGGEGRGKGEEAS